ncbi:MAG: T9SS type A sorting domain-containing protein [Bacteroidia bacterium]
MFKTKCLFTPLLACGLLNGNTQESLAQSLQLRAFDVDTARFEWTGMALNQDADMLAISSLSRAEFRPLPYAESLGDIRLRLHLFSTSHGPANPIQALLPGHARVYDMHWGTGAQGQQLLFIAGAFADSLRIGNQLLLNPESNHYDAFVVALNRQGQLVWHWHRHDTGNQRITRIRPNGAQTNLIISGQQDDSTAWTGILTSGSGGLIWEKSYPGIARISDALFENSNWIKLCGTSQSTALFQGNILPTVQPVTGIQSFLARINPFNDSAEVLSSLAYDRFDLAARLLNNNSGLQEWLAPGLNSNNQRYRIIERLNYPVPNTDTLFHRTGFFMFEDASLNTGITAATHFLYQKPQSSQHEYVLLPITESSTNPMRLVVSAGSGQQFLGHSHASGLVLIAYRTTGSMQVFTQGNADTLNASLSGLSFSNSRWGLYVLSPANSTHITEQPMPQLLLYPNPVREGKLFIGNMHTLSSGFHWELLNLSGSVLGAGAWQPGEAYLQLPDTAAGLYLIRLRINGQQEIRKLLLLP